MRLKFADGHLGPVRQVSAGGGYWSQDSQVIVLAEPAPATQIDVRWPGGKLTNVDLPAGACEIRISPEGKSEVVH